MEAFLKCYSDLHSNAVTNHLSNFNTKILQNKWKAFLKKQRNYLHKFEDNENILQKIYSDGIICHCDFATVKIDKKQSKGTALELTNHGQ